ncbi:MAG: hypothetical protein IT522_16630 [Burkholderiales bacterium]|nr:hypothetical protein [Burkholderiales bacterium]
MTTPTSHAVGTAAAVSGWIEATAYVVVIGALSLIYAIGYTMGAHVIAFILYAMIASSLAMLAFTGVGKDAAAIMRHPASFIVGLSIILIEVCYFLVISYVSPAHGTVVTRISIPLAMLGGALALGRRPPPLASAAALVIVAVTGYAVLISPPDVRWQVAVWGTLTGAFMVVRGFSSEFHPWNRAARTVHEKIRVTGLVVLVTSIIGLVLTALATAATVVGLLPPLPVVPTVAQLLHPPTIVLGALVGGALLTLMAYLNFSAVVKITTENFMAMMALSPVTVWIAQTIGVAAGLITATAVDVRLGAAMAVCVAAVLVIFWSGYRARLAQRVMSPAVTPSVPGSG